MALKTILVALTTSRDNKRVRYPAMSVVNLTAEETKELTALQDATGKPHFRDPVTEGGKPVESQPETVDTGDKGGDYAEADRPMNAKTIKGLQAYLTHNGVEYDKEADKKTLLTAAETHAKGVGSGSTPAGEGDAGSTDPDDGL